ncbi:hypothetical protein OA492_00985 [Pelagibacteraceae bacterium]|nr:hypothetical protein [Pelagibacteraceae bacterium]
MIKILIFFIFLGLLGCSSIKKSNDEVVNISCPTVFFSSESSTYIPSFEDNIDLDDIAFKANLNNFAFSGNCFSDAIFNNYLLDLLILVKPIKPKNNTISLPIFVLLYDKKGQLINKQFFRINKTLEYNQQNLEYNNTEIIQSLNIILQNDKKIDSMIIGFVRVE